MVLPLQLCHSTDLCWMLNATDSTDSTEHEMKMNEWTNEWRKKKNPLRVQNKINRNFWLTQNKLKSLALRQTPSHMFFRYRLSYVIIESYLSFQLFSQHWPCTRDMQVQNWFSATDIECRWWKNMKKRIYAPKSNGWKIKHLDNCQLLPVRFFPVQ